jgi:hypothetical protein
MKKTSAKIDKRRGTKKQKKIPLDRFSENERKRGRPPKIVAAWVRGRADNYRGILDTVWERVAPRLLKAETRDDVVRSLQDANVGGYAIEFVVAADLILQVLHERKFPKRNRAAQINFLADSIAAQGVISPRSSRDICEKERARIKRIHHIIRYEYWIECSCAFKGRSLNHACPKCEAEITLETGSPLDNSYIFQTLSRHT